MKEGLERYVVPLWFLTLAGLAVGVVSGPYDAGPVVRHGISTIHGLLFALATVSTMTFTFVKYACDDGTVGPGTLASLLLLSACGGLYSSELLMKEVHWLLFAQPPFAKGSPVEEMFAPLRLLTTTMGAALTGLLVVSDLVRRKGRLASSAATLVLSLYLGLLFYPVSGFKPASERAATRACFANQKTILGALELYKSDKGTQPRSSPGLWDDLLEAGYLSSRIDDPGQGPNTSAHYRVDPSGSDLTCEVHGKPPRPAGK